MNRNDRACKITLEIFDTNHNILYRAEEKQSGALKVKFNARGDIYFRFTNQYVKSKWIKRINFDRKDLPECSSPLSVSNVESGIKNSLLRKT